MINSQSWIVPNLEELRSIQYKMTKELILFGAHFKEVCNFLIDLIRINI